MVAQLLNYILVLTIPSTRSLQDFGRRIIPPSISIALNIYLYSNVLWNLTKRHRRFLHQTQTGFLITQRDCHRPKYTNDINKSMYLRTRFAGELNALRRRCVALWESGFWHDEGANAHTQVRISLGVRNYTQKHRVANVTRSFHNRPGIS